MDALKELIRMSTAVGSDPSLVLGNFGNTSVKTEDGQWMVIKASGTPLAEVSDKNGWRQVRVADVLTLLDDKHLNRLDPAQRAARIDAALLLACDDGQPAHVKPSVETFFHALLDKAVIHLHPEAVLAAACAKDGQRIVDKLFAKEKFPPLWIPYKDLGYPCARTIQTLAARYETKYGRRPEVMIMQNHGLLVSAATPAAALRQVKKTVAVFTEWQTVPKPLKPASIDAERLNAVRSTIRQAVFNAGGGYVAVRGWLEGKTRALLSGPNAKSLCRGGAITPDEAAVLHGGPLWIETLDAAALTRKLTTIKQANKPLPVAFAVKGLGLFTAAPAKQMPFIGRCARSYVQVRRNALRAGGLRSVPAALAACYAKSKATPAPHGVLSGRLALVTGAGSGLGRSIAIGLARAGASVGLADIDAEAIGQTAQLIADERPDVSTLPLPCNVTDEQAVEKTFQTLMDAWGGLDILVNAAGVAPAFSLVDLPVDKWRFALEVNLTGYFLMAQAAARLMIAQNIGGSIINISSKSGLEPSKNNTPYNATKAGEIHMARGWALELGPHNIRVNSVCPGNVFEGSKIWNPEYIKVCAKKYGIKPDEVIPYYISKTALNREIKGQDIADSVVFLASDQARRITGQTLVTDAGQVYVR